MGEMAGNVIFAAVALFVYALYRLSKVGRRPHGVPPGPPTLPIIGNLHQMAMAGDEPHLLFEKWAQKYGPVYSLMLGTKVMVVLSKDTIIKDLIDKRSSVYNSRPDLYIGNMLSGGHRMLMEPYNTKWRAQRKLIHSALNIHKVEAYSPYIDVEATQLIHDVMQDPTKLLEQFRRYSSSVITSVVYGFRWETFDDPGLQQFFHIIDGIQDLMSSGGATLPDLFPLLRKLPSALLPVTRTATDHHMHEKKIYNAYWQHKKDTILYNPLSARTCTCNDIVAAQQKEHFSDDYATYIASGMVEAGSETTSSELYAFAQAMLLYPSAQSAAHAELDAVIGDTRMPTLEDWRRLPYIRACVKETLRWMPAALLGAVPHALTYEDSYMGYRLPAQSMVTLNVWAIHRDASRYPNPTIFSPERYLHDSTTAAESAVLPDASARDHFAFGAGRRICPGMHLAERSLFLAMARLMWACEFMPVPGKNLPVQDRFVQGMAVRPKDFEVRIVVRKEERRGIVKREWEVVREGLDGKGQFLKNPI